MSPHSPLCCAAIEPICFELVEGGTRYSANRVGREQHRRALADLHGIGRRSVSISLNDTAHNQ